MNVDRRLDLIEARLDRMLDPAPPYAPVEIVRARCKTTIPERAGESDFPVEGISPQLAHEAPRARARATRVAKQQLG